ncbi:hypothetical protein BmR1_04g07220 [Babesia microti strain RI]|uniref:J domain-containing protein n=1 Tax=Babesia microti (strain RI) TaxID=1133968 RepID=I7I9U3_BABMR|nr:hypothetical protein BmR1_04g07220 [Babesia microti strain RI]CCF75639.1 hypothetical protein BmR1_04g07220 [Babesia microti strain RI]|eukprot:XP_012650047.1 hypothetical protein BmR1_04g07220 [Babesia microti strain RI]
MLNLEKAFELLGLQRNDVISDIRCKYLKLAKKTHPDKSQNQNINAAEATNNFIAIKEAYEYLLENIKSKKLLSELGHNSKFDGFVETVDFSELGYDEQISCHVYICRCGEIVQLRNFEAMGYKLESFSCQACSLRVKIILSSSS